MARIIQSPLRNDGELSEVDKARRKSLLRWRRPHKGEEKAYSGGQGRRVSAVDSLKGVACRKGNESCIPTELVEGSFKRWIPKFHSGGKVCGFDATKESKSVQDVEKNKGKGTRPKISWADYLGKPLVTCYTSNKESLHGCCDVGNATPVATERVSCGEVEKTRGYKGDPRAKVDSKGARSYKEVLLQPSVQSWSTHFLKPRGQG